MTITLNSRSSRLLISAVLFFSEVLSRSFIWNMCFRLILLNSLSFHVLGRSVMSSSLEEVAFCRKPPVGPGGANPPSRPSQVLPGFPSAVRMPSSAVVGPQLSCVH